VTTHVEDALRGVHGIDVGRVAHSVATGSTKQAIAAAPPAARGAIGHAARSAFVAGLNEIFLIGAIVAFAGAAPASRSSDAATSSGGETGPRRLSASSRPTA
jgi:hypothetical protein